MPIDKIVANLAEGQLASADSDAHVLALREHAKKQGAPVVPICAAISVSRNMPR